MTERGKFSQQQSPPSPTGEASSSVGEAYISLYLPTATFEASEKDLNKKLCDVMFAKIAKFMHWLVLFEMQTFILFFLLCS